MFRMPNGRKSNVCSVHGSLIRFKKTKQAKRRKHVTNHKTITRIFAREQRIHENNVADKCNEEFCVVFSSIDSRICFKKFE